MSVPKRDTSLEAFKCYVCNEVVDMVTHLRLSRLPEVDGQRQSKREERRARGRSPSLRMQKVRGIGPRRLPELERQRQRILKLERQLANESSRTQRLQKSLDLMKRREARSTNMSAAEGTRKSLESQRVFHETEEKLRKEYGVVVEKLWYRDELLEDHPQDPEVQTAACKALKHFWFAAAKFPPREVHPSSEDFFHLLRSRLGGCA